MSRQSYLPLLQIFGLPEDLELRPDPWAAGDPWEFCPSRWAFSTVGFTDAERRRLQAFKDAAKRLYHDLDFAVFPQLKEFLNGLVESGDPHRTIQGLLDMRDLMRGPLADRGTAASPIWLRSADRLTEILEDSFFELCSFACLATRSVPRTGWRRFVWWTLSLNRGDVFSRNTRSSYRRSMRRSWLRRIHWRPEATRHDPRRRRAPRALGRDQPLQVLW
jgi:hypothetical protein